MGEWKHSGTIKLPFPVEASFLLSMPDRTIQGLFRNDDVLEFWTRGSQSPFPWIRQAIIPGKYKGSGNIILYADGNYLIGWSDISGVLQTWWSRPDEWPDPSGPDPIDKKLSVSGGVLRYGDVDKFCGASDRLALLKKTGEHGFDPWPPDYQFEDYEQDLIDSGINYVRHIGSMDYPFLKKHCQDMKDNNIVVEIEVYDPALLDFPFVEIDKMGELAELGNVLFDVGNEFLNYEPAIDIVIDICKNLKKQGCLVGAGAWSGEKGKGYSGIFHDEYSGHDYETHHRHWVESHWKKTLEFGKPVMWNEFFNLTNMTLADVELLIRQAFKAGCQGVQYYCWFGPPDTLAFKDVLNIAGKLLKG